LRQKYLTYYKVGHFGFVVAVVEFVEMPHWVVFDFVVDIVVVDND